MLILMHNNFNTQPKWGSLIMKHLYSTEGTPLNISLSRQSPFGTTVTPQTLAALYLGSFCRLDTPFLP